WPDMIPRAKLTILCGDPGLGKSFMTLDVLSRLSRGWPMPGDMAGEPRAPMGGILLSAEDDPADTIRPRLEGMGADLEKVVVFDGLEAVNGDVYNFVLTDHIKQLYELVESTGNVGLVVVDPISAYVGDTDSYNNAHVRAMLKPLSDMAADLDVAVVLVTHLRKGGGGGGEGGSALHRAMGSLAFTAAARTVLVVTKDQDDPNTRLLLVAKSNVGNDRVGWSYKLQEGKVCWQQRIEAGADEILSGSTTPSHAKRTASLDAFAIDLRSKLATAPGGCVSVDVVRETATAHGLGFEQVNQSATKARLGFGTVGRGKASQWRNREAGEGGEEEEG
ncbi:MAG: AAA family ATPase, partial [Phycisphaerales bacterium]|nr:AAA family ATPase [Phycisphaerales bacterium]